MKIAFWEFTEQMGGRVHVNLGHVVSIQPCQMACLIENKWEDINGSSLQMPGGTIKIRESNETLWKIISEIGCN